MRKPTIFGLSFTCYVSLGNLYIVPGWDQPKVCRTSKVIHICANSTDSNEKEDSNFDMMRTPFVLKKLWHRRLWNPKQRYLSIWVIYIVPGWCQWKVCRVNKVIHFLWLFTSIACVHYSLCVGQTNCGSVLLMTLAWYYEGTQSCILEYWFQGESGRDFDDILCRKFEEVHIDQCNP